MPISCCGSYQQVKGRENTNIFSLLEQQKQQQQQPRRAATCFPKGICR